MKKYDPVRADESCPTENFGGPLISGGPDTKMEELRLLSLIWRLVKIFFRYGNQEIYYHICGGIGKGCYDVPMEAENVEVRLTNSGPKVTIW